MVRISILLVASAKKWHRLFNVDHHTVYSVCNYILIILLVYLFSKRVRKLAGISRPAVNGKDQLLAVHEQ